MKARVASPLFFLVVAAMTVGDAVAQDSSDVAFQLKPGDIVRLALSREADMSGEYPVDETGTVALPLIGLRSVTGKSPAVLKRELVGAYEEQLQNQTIQVTFLRRVRVLGEVNSPGLYHADPTMTLGDVVALAGGTTTQGKLDGIKIARGSEEFDVDLDRDVLDQVRSGDRIVVPRRSWFSRNSTVLVTASISVAAIVISANR